MGKFYKKRIMFPLPTKIQQGYTFGQPTFYGVPHKGTDYKAKYDSFYVPFPSKVLQFDDVGGGKWMRFTRPNGDIIEVAHLSQRLLPTNAIVRAGDNAGITGNSGAYTTNPHLHIQVKVQGKLIDPETYQWVPKATYPIQLTTTILLNKMNWDKTLLQKMAQLQDWFWTASNHRIQVLRRETAGGSHYRRVVQQIHNRKHPKVRYNDASHKQGRLARAGL